MSASQLVLRRDTFKERPDNPHVAQRQVLMSMTHPAPPRNAEVAEDVSAAIAIARRSLAADGYALIQMDEPLDDAAFLTFGWSLGVPEPEHDPFASQHTTHGFILNLTSLCGRNASTEAQPFSTDYLRLHTESSRRPADQQPRYIVLMCIEPGDDATRAQTVMVPMAPVAARLSHEGRALLADMRYANSPAAPAVLRNTPNGPVFSFRDFGEDPLDWVRITGEAEAGRDGEDGALCELLAALYSGDGWYGLTWRRGLLFVIDNTRHFHGRTEAGAIPVGVPRHLKRLRLLQHG